MDSYTVADATALVTGMANSASASLSSPPVLAEIISVPVNQSSEAYKMDHLKRGYAYVFHHETFDDHLLLDQRADDNNLEKKLIDVLTRLNFEVKCFRDFKYEEIKTQVQSLSEQDDLKDCDCLLVIIMTHGFLNDQLYAKNTHYHPDFLKMHFTTNQCQLLAGKPKLFIIQACRGNKNDYGTRIKNKDKNNDGPICDNGIYKLPAHADFLTAYATVPSYTAYRIPFIKYLCEVLSSKEAISGEIDFLSMLTIVQRKVAIEFENESGEKQLPCVMSSLTRKIYFTPKAAGQGLSIAAGNEVQIWY